MDLSHDVLLLNSSPFTGKWKPNDYPFVDNVRAIYLTLEKLIQPEETQVNGIVILADYSGVGMSQASNPGPFLAKKVVSILQVKTKTRLSNNLMNFKMKLENSCNFHDMCLRYSVYSRENKCLIRKFYRFYHLQSMYLSLSIIFYIHIYIFICA